jgi:hypothetical protein
MAFASGLAAVAFGVLGTLVTRRGRPSDELEILLIFVCPMESYDWNNDYLSKRCQAKKNPRVAVLAVVGIGFFRENKPHTPSPAPLVRSSCGGRASSRRPRASARRSRCSPWRADRAARRREARRSISAKRKHRRAGRFRCRRRLDCPSRAALI